MLSSINSWLQELYPPLHGGDELGRVRTCLLGGRRPDRSTIIVFRGLELWPSVVVKVAFSEEGARQLDREANTLNRAQQELSGLVEQPIPRQLGSIHRSEFAALATGALRGHRKPLPDITVPSASWDAKRRLTRHVNAVRAWSRSLGSAGPSHKPKRDGRFSQQRIQRFVTLGNPPEPASKHLQSLGAAFANAGLRWSTRWQHGDVAPGNVLWHEGKVRLVDWEAASPEHDPWRDDAYLLLSLARVAQHKLETPRLSKAFRRALASDGWAGRLLAENFQDNWPHPIPIGWAVVATSIEHALERENRGLTTAFWRDLVIDLVNDDDLRSNCGWLVPHW